MSENNLRLWQAAFLLLKKTKWKPLQALGKKKNKLKNPSLSVIRYFFRGAKASNYQTTLLFLQGYVPYD